MGCIQSALASAQVPGSPRPTEELVAEGGTSTMTAPSHEISYEMSSFKPQRPRNAGVQRLEGLLIDEDINSIRIPRELITIHRLLCSGSYTEVFLGTYHDGHVAVKMLLPETRRSMDHVEALLTEVKIMATMDHPHIVTLVGVAWDVLADICMVSEYMEGGDLRALLASYETESYPHGFDRQKLTIALNVALALTYMHSFQPPVLHANLKSTNILLSAEIEAKISSFGSVNQRPNCTLGGSSGLHLWTAPEVLMGERFDAKADIYSFGVVLSELDQHVLPYSSINDELGQKLTNQSIVLMMVARGELRVEFTSSASGRTRQASSDVHVMNSIDALGTSCVALAPEYRPTAAEVAYNLHKILQQYTNYW